MSTPRLTRGNQLQQFSSNGRVRRSESNTEQRVIEVEMGSFTPLIFGTNGRTGDECNMCMKHLAQKLAERDVECYPFVISWFRTRISFEMLNSVNTSIRGSCQPVFRSRDVNDFKVNCTAADRFF